LLLFTRPIDGGINRDTADPDCAVGGNEDVVWSQPKVVKASLPGDLEGLGGFSRHTARFLGRQWPLDEDGSQRL
jgi:hypothetical protein